MDSNYSCVNPLSFIGFIVHLFDNTASILEFCTMFRLLLETNGKFHATILCLLLASVFITSGSSILIVDISSPATTSNYCTLLGGTSGEDATKASFDNEGNTILIGQTHSDDFPVTDNAIQSSYGGGDWDAFVAKFSPSGELLYATYLGGNSYEHITSVNVDSENNIIVAGVTFSSGFPTTSDAFQPSSAGAGDGFITKIAPNGTLLYSTFFGGTGEDWIYGMEFDASGNYMFGGHTRSTGLGTAGAFQTTLRGGADVFIARLSADGTTKQMFSYVGGTGIEYGWTMTTDSSYNYIISGITSSTNYPVTPNAFQSSPTAHGDAILSKLSYNGSLLLYSTLVGGNDEDLGLGIDVDSAGCILLTGYTESDNLVVENAMQSSFGGGSADIYLAKFNSTGFLQFLTYLGGNETDYAWDLRVNPDDEIVIVGRTSSSNYPAHDCLNDTFSGAFDAVATMVSSDGQTIIASSFIGGFGVDIGEGIAIDAEGNVVITGRTASANFPVTAGAYQDENAGSTDVFVCHTAFGLTATTTTTTNNGFIDLTFVIFAAIVAIGIVMVVIIIVKRR
jgi:hypothetical protein